ncbi:MAG: transcriptional regulator NrdR [Leptospirales bacterium]|nr:transcriptional regulator NrdR [Leptospirales bacterium]
MKCPYCSSHSHRVIDKRESVEVGTNSIKRRRECTDCSKRFTTYERVDTSNIMVVKKDRTRQPFDRNKVLRGIMKAVEKRPVSSETIDLTVDSVEALVRKNYDKEVNSIEIGRLIIEELKGVDEVAYIRFASVYKDFKDAESFEEEVKNLRK